MNLYLQLLTRDQTVKAVDLVQAPFFFSSDGESRARANLARGKVMRIAMSRLASLSEKLVRNGFNKVEVIYDIKAIKLSSRTFKVRLSKGLLTPFPTSVLWLPSDRFVVQDRASDCRQIHAKGVEQSVSRFKLRDMPVSFDMVLTFARAQNKEKILDDVAGSIAGIWRKFADLRLFGCCDVGGRGLYFDHLVSTGRVDFMERKENMFLPYTKDQELGKKFRTLHPVMFGPPKVCLGIVSCLGKHARVIEGNGKSEFVVIRLGPSSALSSLEKRAKRWLVKWGGSVH